MEQYYQTLGGHAILPSSSAFDKNCIIGIIYHEKIFVRKGAIRTMNQLYQLPWEAQGSIIVLLAIAILVIASIPTILMLMGASAGKSTSQMTKRSSKK